MARTFYGKFMSEKVCKDCHGKRLSEQALCVKINEKSIIDLTEMSIDKLIDFFLNLELTPMQKSIAKLALKEIINRLTFLKNVGLDYLTLARSANTLSGG